MKTFKKVLASALAAAMVVTAFPVTNAEAATAPKLSTTKATLYVGQSKTITVKNLTSTWKGAKVVSASDKKSVATVSRKGNKITVKAVKAGTAKVTVKVTPKKGAAKKLTAKITVKTPSVKFTDAVTELTVGETATVKATSTPATSIKYYSADKSIATVGLTSGKVTAKAEGTVKIAAVIKTGTKTTKAYTTITVKSGFGVSDLKATSASTLVATLTAPLTETAKVEVTKAGITTPVAGEAKADGTTLTFSTTANMTAGTYTLTITDGDLTSSKSVEIQNEYVKEIVIKSTQALTDVNAKTKAYIYYDVLNQYGESVRLSTSIEWSSSAAKPVKADKATGKITLENDKAFVYGNQIYVTGVYTKTGVSVNKAVTVGMEQALNSVETMGFVDKNKPTTKIDALPSDFAKDTYYMIYATKDQDGNLLDASASNVQDGKVTFISDNIMLLKVQDKDASGNSTERTFTIDGVEYSAILVQPGQYVDKGGEVNITAISNKTGNKSNKNYVIGSNVLLGSLTITGPDGVVADGDQNVNLSYVAQDTAGNNITNYESIVRSTNTLSLTVSEGKLVVYEKKDGTAGIKWSDSTHNWGASETQDEVDRTVAITTVVVGGTSNNYLLSVSDKRKPVAIKEIKSINGGANAIVASGSATVDFTKDTDVVYLDQYGADMAATTAKAFFDYSYDSGFGRDNMAYGVLVDYANTNDFVGANDTVCKKSAYSVTLNAKVVSAAQNNTVKFSIAQAKLADKDNGATSYDVAGKVKTLTIDVVPVDKLTGIAFASVGKQKLETGKENFANGAEADLAEVITGSISDSTVGFNDDGFEVKITGNYQGKALTIPTAYYTIDTTNVTTAAAVDPVNATKIAAVSGPTMKWSELYDSNSARLTRKDATVTIKADVFNTTAKASQDKNATVKLSVKVSDEARKASKIVIKEGAAATKQVSNTTKAAASWFALDDPTAPNGVYVLDQYDAKMSIGSNYSFTFADLKEATTEFTHLKDSLKVNANGSYTANVDKAEIGDSFKLTITGTDTKGVSVSADIVITLGGDTLANAESGVDFKSTDDHTLRVTLGYDR